MQEWPSTLKISVNPNVYLKNPESSELGKRIVSQGILLIDKLGFDDFTFRKLGEKIQSPEASVYRYFEGKYKFLIYLTSWYWGWMEYRLILALTNVSSPEVRLEKAIALIAGRMEGPFPEDFELDFAKLHSIVTIESSKSYLTKNVDRENKEGAFMSYKQFVARISSIILEINPRFKYPNMLVTTIIEGSHHQQFFGEHLPGLTNRQKNEDYIRDFYTELALKAIKPKR